MGLEIKYGDEEVFRFMKAFLKSAYRNQNISLSDKSVSAKVYLKKKKKCDCTFLKNKKNI